MRGRIGQPLLSLVAVALCCGASASLATTAEWPGLRGPHYDGAIAGSLFSGDERSLDVSWNVPLGSGYSGLVVGDDRVITGFTAGDSDVLAAFSVADGAELWRYRMSDKYTGHDGSHDGPIATPVVDGDRVIGLSTYGDLFAVEAATGTEIWRSHLKDDHGATKPHYGFGSSPVVLDGIVVVHLGVEDGAALAGFDTATGEQRWTLGEGKVDYQSPVIATLGGKPQVVAASGSTLYGIDAANGAVLWSHEHGGDGRAMSSASIVPVPAGDDRIFVNHAMNGSAVLHVSHGSDGWTIAEKWSENLLARSYVVPVHHKGTLYGIQGRVLTAVNAETGERLWRSRNPGDGFPSVIGDHLAIQTKAGSLYIADASTAGYTEVASLDLFSTHSWAPPVYANGRLFVRSMDRLAAIDPVSGDSGTDGADRSWLAETAFGKFLAEVDAASGDTKATVVDAYLESQSSFPIIEPSGTVHFVYRGDAEDVGIVGDMIGFRREDPMTRVAGTDLFYYSTRLEPEAAVCYGFIPNYETAIADPRNPRPGKGLFGEVSFMAMPAWSPPAFEGAETASSGRLETVEWDSAVRETKRQLAVYLPAGYDDHPERRYPTVYVHGANAHDDGQMTKVLDRVLGQSVEPLIAVFILPDAENARADDREPQKYMQMLIAEVVPKVDAEFRTIPERMSRATVGAGQGGNGALHTGLRFPDTFGKIAAQSATIMDPGELSDAIDVAAGRNFVIWHGWGTYHLRSPHEAWDMAESSRQLHSILRENGYRPGGGEAPDGFGWNVWTARIDDWLEALFPIH